MILKIIFKPRLEKDSYVHIPALNAITELIIQRWTESTHVTHSIVPSTMLYCRFLRRDIRLEEWDFSLETLMQVMNSPILSSFTNLAKE